MTGFNKHAEHPPIYSSLRTFLRHQALEGMSPHVLNKIISRDVPRFALEMIGDHITTDVAKESLMDPISRLNNVPGSGSCKVFPLPTAAVTPKASTFSCLNLVPHLVCGTPHHANLDRPLHAANGQYRMAQVDYVRNTKASPSMRHIRSHSNGQVVPRTNSIRSVLHSFDNMPIAFPLHECERLLPKYVASQLRMLDTIRLATDPKRSSWDDRASLQEIAASLDAYVRNKGTACAIALIHANMVTSMMAVYPGQSFYIYPCATGSTPACIYQTTHISNLVGSAAARYHARTDTTPYQSRTQDDKFTVRMFGSDGLAQCLKRLGTVQYQNDKRDPIMNVPTFNLFPVETNGANEGDDEAEQSEESANGLSTESIEEPSAQQEVETAPRPSPKRARSTGKGTGKGKGTPVVRVLPPQRMTTRRASKRLRGDDSRSVSSPAASQTPLPVRRSIPLSATASESSASYESEYATEDESDSE